MMIKPLQRLVGPFSKSAKITPLTKMVRDFGDYDKFNSLVSFNNIATFSSELLEIQTFGEDMYAIPRTEKHSLISSEDLEDYSYILQKFDSMLNGLLRTLFGIRKQIQHKVVNLEFEKIESYRRYNKLKEKLLDKTDEVEEVEAKTGITDKEKIEKLKQALIAMGFTGAVISGAVDPGTVTLSGNISQKAAQLAKKLVSDLGITDFQAAGIVGNLLREGFGKGIPDDIQDGTYSRESGPPPAYGTMGVGYGWAQWTNGGNNGPEDRLNKFIIRLGGGPGKQARAATDADNYAYLLDDFRGRYANVLQSLKATTNVTQAAEVILKQYERPANQGPAVVQTRAQHANAVLQEMKKASGGIVIPEIIPNHTIDYDTTKKNTLLSNFIVDKPTIIDVSKVGEPLVVIPTERPIGKTILKMIFDKPFKKIEDSFKPILMKDKIFEKEPRVVVPETKISTNKEPQNKQLKITNIDVNYDMKYEYDEEDLPDMINPLPNMKENIIDITENKTDDILDSSSQNVIIFTQDIFVN